MTLNPVIEEFYINVLDFAGLTYEDGIIKNKDERIGDLTIKGKKLTLPYNSNLKNPDNKIIFHPLNESYTNPLTSQFSLFKKRLVLELNLKLSHLIVSLATVATDVQMQKKIKSSSLINIISELGEVDHKFIENFLHISKASKEENEEAFLLDIFLKKNGSIDGVPFSAIGKINFVLYKQIEKTLKEGKSPYTIYGYKVRKKDLLTLSAIFNLIFPNIDDEVRYTEGTDNKVFRYFNVLLKSSYLVGKHINDIIDLLEEIKEPSLDLDSCKLNLNWINSLEKLYDMKAEIRLIPNQTDISLEESKRLNIDESKMKEDVSSVKSFSPEQVVQQINPSQVTPQEVNQQASQPTKLTPEDIIRGNLQQPVPTQPMIQPQPMLQQPQPMPRWVQMEAMQQQQTTAQQPVVQQPMMQQQPAMQQQPMFQQQPMMQQQPAMQQQPMFQQQPMMQQQPVTQQGLQINPMFG